MPNLAGILKDEVRRLARKEIKAELTATKKASAQYRRDIAALKRQLRDQAKQITLQGGDLFRLITSLERANRKGGGAGSEGTAAAARFSPKWLQAHRERLELSAADYAALMGVSSQTVYNWEKGRTRPQPQQLQAWSAVRGLGKREAWKRLDEME